MYLLRLLFLCAIVINPAPLLADEKPPATLYKNPECGCCEGHAEHLRQHGYAVNVRPTHDLSLIKRTYRVPANLAGCHTTVVGSYVVEGHVPAGMIDRLLAERPDIRGISLPGMPAGSPGMSGEKSEPFVIYEIADGPPKTYAID
jgi:hypothetical protein